MYFFKIWCDMELRYIPPPAPSPSTDASLFSLGTGSTPAQNKLKIHIYLNFFTPLPIPEHGKVCFQTFSFVLFVTLVHNKHHYKYNNLIIYIVLREKRLISKLKLIQIQHVT